jgi:hypothetical protein
MTPYHKSWNWHRYAVRVKHDTGTATITVTTPGRESAIATIMHSEKCPRRAILGARRVKPLTSPLFLLL